VAIDRTDLSTAVLLNYTSPLWAAVLAALFLRESPPRSIYWAFPVAFLGIYLLVGGAPERITTARMWGYAAGLASAVLAGVAYTSVRQLGSRVSAAMVVFWFSWVTCLLVLPFLPSTYRTPCAIEWVLLLLAGLTAGIAQQLMTIGYQLNRAARASTINLATVGFTTILAVAFLGETLTLRDGAGLVLILVGIGAAASPVPEPAPQTTQ
ncbi:MAG: DMT family transporter, partial [Candidatus Eremiobacterota bacterium]